MTIRTQQFAVLATCVLAALTYAGAVTTFALAVFVLPAVAMAAAAGLFFAERHMFGTAIIFGGLFVLGWSELVNIVSGAADGPAARATFVAAGWTLVAVVVAQSRSPAFFLVAVAGSVCGAMLLGAGGEARSVAVAVAVAAALTLGSIEQSRRNWTAPPTRDFALVLLPLLVGAVAAGVVLLQVNHDQGQPRALGSGLAYPGIKPPWTDPLGMTRKLTSPPTAQTRSRRKGSDLSSPRPTTHERAATKTSTVTTKHQSLFRIWPYVLIVILLVALVVQARLLAVRFAWLRVRRRLSVGAPSQQIIGAWAWVRIRLEACRLPLPAAASPDVVAAGRAAPDLPAGVRAPLQALAASTTTAAFANGQPLGAAEVTAAWSAADRADASARELLTRHARVGLAFRGPRRRAGVR